jgi:putative addiction module component (TIGR02574 family)
MRRQKRALREPLSIADTQEPIMPRTVLQLVQDQALELTEQERADLTHDLFVSLDGPADANAAEAWNVEIVRRVVEIDAATGTFLDADEITRKIRSRLGES